MIDPSTNKSGESFQSYCERRWGGSGWTQHLVQEGRKDGAMFADWKWWPHTLKAHQLILFAKQQGGVDTSISKAALFQALYEEGENISCVDTLVNVVGTRLGLSSEDLRSYLNEDRGAAEVMNEIQTGRQKYKIRGVPFFVVDGDGTDRPTALSGAQKAATFVELFYQASGEEAPN